MPYYEYVCELQGEPMYMEQEDYNEYRYSLIHFFRSGMSVNVFEDNAREQPEPYGCRHFWLHVVAPSAFSAVFVCIGCDAIVEYASGPDGHH